MLPLVLVILLLELAVVLPLSANRRSLRRVSLLALALEIVKLIFAFTAGAWLLASDGVGATLAVVFFHTAMLAERLAGGEFGPTSAQGWLVVFLVGVVWNLAPAFLIDLLLPSRRRSRPSAT